jgi:phosphohistidine swiveling domain-containing protein
MLLNEIKQRDWKYLVNRKEALLMVSITANSSKYFKKLTGIPKMLKNRIHFSNGDLFYESKNIEDINYVFKKGGYKLLVNFRKKMIKNVRELDYIARKIEKTNCTQLNKTELNKLLNKYLKITLYVHNYLAPISTADKILSEMISDALPNTEEKKQREWLRILVYPIRENEHTREERSFFNILLAYKRKDKDLDKLLVRHLKQFRWIGARLYFWHNYWTEDMIKKRLDNFLKQNKNPKKELKHLEQVKLERKLSMEKLLKKLNIGKSSSLYKLIKLAQEYAYLRTWRTDIIYGSGYRVREIFYEVARRAGIDEKDIYYLTYQEVIKTAKNYKLSISKKEIVKRKEFFIDVMIDNKYLVLSGKQWGEKIRKVITKQKVRRLRTIRGNSAFAGKVRGKVKIVLTSDDISKVKQGDILVAIMTFPHFVPAMEVAKAFVTDEGGILCHAAIIAREMSKPCIIGTKIATKVLKDGDLVEVDANKGIIKKID